MGKEILTLDTLEPDRDFIVVNKASFFLRGDDELSLTQIARIRRLSKTVLEKGISEDSTEQDMVEVERYADEILGMIVLDLPAEVRDKLSTMQKFQIVRAFMTAAAQRRAKTAAGESAGRLTTDGSSPDSSGSTGVPSASG
jgi:hypothetical protein